MNALVFAYAMHLHKQSSDSEMLTMLPARDRAEVEAALKQTAGVSEKEIGRRLHAHRAQGCRRQRKDAGIKTGMNMSRVAPKLAAWLSRPF